MACLTRFAKPRSGQFAPLASFVKPYLNTEFYQPIDFARILAKFAKTWHYAPKIEYLRLHWHLYRSSHAHLLKNAFSETRISRVATNPWANSIVKIINTVGNQGKNRQNVALHFAESHHWRQ